MRRRAVFGATLALCCAAVPTGSDAAAAPARTIKVSARSYAFSPSKLAVRVRETVTIALHSTDTFHDFVVDGRGVDGQLVVKVSGGQTRRGTLRLTKRGKYTFACSVPGHRAAGMRGTITVS